MHTFTLPIGDWSDDGHGKCDTYTVTCSHSPSDCRQAYLDSCKLTGYQFHDGSHKHPYDPASVLMGEVLLANYEERTIPWHAVVALESAGLDILPLLDDTWKEGEEVSIQSDELMKILMEFIGLSLTEFIWSEVPRENSLFGYWNDELNVQMGYGCFE